MLTLSSKNKQAKLKVNHPDSFLWLICHLLVLSPLLLTSGFQVLACIRISFFFFYFLGNFLKQNFGIHSQSFWFSKQSMAWHCWLGKHILRISGLTFSRLSPSLIPYLDNSLLTDVSTTCLLSSLNNLPKSINLVGQIKLPQKSYSVHFM